jgi:hypothetical protein
MADLSPAPDQEAILKAWCAALVDRLSLDGVEVDVDAVLGLAGEIAHAVIRPAAPLTAYVVGYAAGRAVESGASTDASAFAAAAGHARAAARDFAPGNTAVEEPAVEDTAIEDTAVHNNHAAS